MTPEALAENRKQVREEFTADSPWRLINDPTGEGDPNYFAIYGGTGWFDDENPQGFSLKGFLPKSDALKIVAAPTMLFALKALAKPYEDIDGAYLAEIAEGKVGAVRFGKRVLDEHTANAVIAARAVLAQVEGV